MGKSGPRARYAGTKARQHRAGYRARHQRSRPGARFGCSKFAIIRHARARLDPAQRAPLSTPRSLAPSTYRPCRHRRAKGCCTLWWPSERDCISTRAQAGFGDIKGAVAAEGAIRRQPSARGEDWGGVGAAARCAALRRLTRLPSTSSCGRRCVQALKPFLPPAGPAVAGALYALESDAAKEIEQSPGPPRS